MRIHLTYYIQGLQYWFFLSYIIRNFFQLFFAFTPSKTPTDWEFRQPTFGYSELSFWKNFLFSYLKVSYFFKKSLKWVVQPVKSLRTHHTVYTIYSHFSMLLPGRRCKGRALPLLWRDRSMCTGVDLGEMKGDAGGLWPLPGWQARGEMGWKEKWRRRVPGDGGMGHVTAPVWLTPSTKVVQAHIHIRVNSN